MRRHEVHLRNLGKRPHDPWEGERAHIFLPCDRTGTDRGTSKSGLVFQTSNIQKKGGPTGQIEKQNRGIDRILEREGGS